MARTRGIRRIPSGGEAGLSAEPKPIERPLRVSAARIVGSGALAAALVLLFDRVFKGPDSHLGPVRVLTTWLHDAMGKPPPLEGALVLSLHFAICVLYAAILSQVVVRMITRQAIVVGAVFGVLLYFWHFYGLSPLAPWLVDGRDALNLATHVLFGVIVAVAVRSPRLP